MRQYYFLTIMLTACNLSHAQAPVTLQYDAAGNRSVRTVAALPVTLISFKAEKEINDQKQPSALLTWRTASEVNSDHFVIQRSADGKRWQEIGVVSASGDRASDTDYSFVDESPMDGENVYRLKMVDRDGTFAYSSLQSLNFGSLIAFFPNPVKARLWIKGLVGVEAKTFRVQIWDASGRLVRESRSIPAEGIDMAMLPTGIYTVGITGSNGNATVRKVVKE